MPEFIYVSHLRTALIMMSVGFFLLPVAWGKESPVSLSIEEKQQVYDLLRKQDGRINNLYVRFIRTNRETVSGDEEWCQYEWARSGEKRYRKRWWTSPIGEPLAERWGIAVWDGKLLKAYDSEIDNGSVRAEYDPMKDAQENTVVTYTPYNQLTGHLYNGTLAEMLSRKKLEEWEAKWVESGRQVSIRFRPEGDRDHNWTVDLERGGLIVEYFPDPWGNTGADMKPKWKFTVVSADEVEPGLWLPTEAISYALGRNGLVDFSLKVEELKVNDPSIEDMFQFTFPEGSMYYDFVLNSSMYVNMQREVFEAKLNTQADNLTKVTAISNESQNPQDDFAVADKLTGGITAPLDPGPENKYGKRLLWLLCGVALLLAAIGTALRKVSFKKRRTEMQPADNKEERYS